jgi:hypothetical protein
VSTRTSSSLYFGRLGVGEGRSLIAVPGRWKRPVGKKVGRSVRRREDSLRLKGSWEMTSFTISLINVDAIVER